MKEGDRTDMKTLALLLGAALLILVLILWLGTPLLSQAGTAMASGVGLKTAAIWGFFVTVGLFVLFAVVSGDGMIGEIQFMLGSFFLFYIVLTLLIAWVF